MICAHDLFTYGRVDNGFPTGDIFRSYEGLWRCQRRNEQQLYDLGVRMFDCRVYWDDKYWRAAHGAVNFKITFNTLEDLCNHFDSLGGDALYRIVLEKDDNNGEAKFREQASGLCARHPNIWTILIKYKTSNWLNDSGMVENNIDSLVSRGYTFANHSAWESPNKEYNVPPPSFSLSNISTYASYDIEDHAKNGFTDKNGGVHEPNPNPTTLDMLHSKEYLYSMDYCHIYIGNDRFMPYGELSTKYNLTASEAEVKKVLPKSDLVAKGYRISGNYADNQLVIGNDISK